MPPKPKVVQPGKQQKNPKVYDVSKYPYVARKPYGEATYYPSLTQARKGLVTEVLGLQKQFKNLKGPIAANCEQITSAINQLGAEGGSICMPIEANVFYRVELSRRQAA